MYIPQLKGPLTIYGSTKDTTSYASNQVTITANGALKNAANDDATATLRVWTTNFKMCKWGFKPRRGFVTRPATDTSSLIQTTST